MADPKLTQLVNDLYVKSAAGLLNWRQTSEESVFSLSFSSHSMVLTYKAEWDDVRDDTYESITLQIRDESGAVIEEITPGTFSPKDFGILPFDVFKRIYESARRHAMGLNKAVDAILLELNPPPDDLPF